MPHPRLWTRWPAASTTTSRHRSRRLDPSSTRRRPVPLSGSCYSLDHEYTASGLSWSRLKGSDAKRAGVLRAAAARADCDIVLALADVHETWSCFEPDWDGRWYARRSGGWDEPDDDDVWAGDVDASSSDQGLIDSDGYVLDELIDWTITLDRWIEPSRTRAETIATSVDDVEVCSSTPSAALRPYASEYEGYMGNYGNTMDRWYRRCGLVVWPRHRAFTVRAEASPMWALDALSARVRDADVTGAQELAATVTPFWNAVAVREERSRFFGKALRIARCSTSRRWRRCC